MTTDAERTKITREVALKQAAALKKQAEALRKRATTITDYRYESVEKHWSDAVSKKYLHQMRLNIANMEEAATNLEHIAEGMEKAAELLTS